MDIIRDLTEGERKFLANAARRGKLFLASSLATVVVAATLLCYHGLIARDLNGPRFVIILLLLLSGRSYLRLYRSSTIFRKLQSGAGSPTGSE